MRSQFIIAGAVVLTASVAGAQEMAPQERTTAVAERHAVEVMVQAQAQGMKLARVPLESKTIKGAPYSAEVVNEDTQVLADGNRIVHRTTGRVYRDSQGRTRREEDIEPGRVGGIRISDPVAQVAYALDVQSRTAWKTPVATAEVLYHAQLKTTTADPAQLELRQKLENEIVAAARAGGVAGGVMVVTPHAEVEHAGSWDEKTETLPAKNIEGVMAEGKRITRTVPAGAIGNEQPIVSVTEEWRSPDLQVLVMTRTSDPRSGESTYKLLNITRAEPSASWFEVPADYTVKESGVRRLQPAK
jgi:hypothetical protein